jgi:hypothetical protein
MYNVQQLVRSGWLNSVTIGPKFMGQIDIARFARRSEHHHRQSAKSGLLAYPPQDTKPVKSRHLDVEQHQVWQRKILAIGVWGGASQIIHSLLPVVDKLHGRVNSGSQKGSLEKKRVVRVIFGNENFEVAIHAPQWSFEVVLAAGIIRHDRCAARFYLDGQYFKPKP